MRKAAWRSSLAARCLMTGVALVLVVGPALAATVRDAISASTTNNTEAKASQKKIDKISDDIDTLAAEYRAALQETRALEVYNRQLQTLIASQKSEMESLRRQIDSVTVIGREVMPLMAKQIEALEQFVQLDVPFQQEERTKRTANLRAMMDRADVTISEKYRRIMEAFQIENEYGRTIETYRSELDNGGTTITVDFLRIGRVALLYQTLDAEQSGAWDQKSRSWQQLDDSYRTAIKQGLRMARKQAAPDLLRVPLPAAEAVQ